MDPRRDDPPIRAVVDELQLAVDHGFTVGVLPLASRIDGAPSIAGPVRDLLQLPTVTLLRPDRPVAAFVVLLRDTEVLRQVQEVSPDVHAPRTVITLDATLLETDGSDGVPASPARFLKELAGAARLLGERPLTLRPVGDAARRWLDVHAPDVALDADWPDVHRDPDTFLRTLADMVAGGHADSALAEAAQLTADRPILGAGPPEPGADTSRAGAAATPPPWRIGPVAGPHAHVGVRGRVLFFTDNGHGLGHITRLMAVARHLPPSLVPTFLTLSETHPVVRQLGFPVEHFPSRHRLGIERERWEAMLRIRLDRALHTLRPAVLVVDHGLPPRALIAAARQAGVRLVWSRRGLWKPGRNADALALAPSFDAVIEPGDLASPADRGATRDSDAYRVPPVTLVGRGDLMPRDRARAELGLPLDGPALLLQLAADDTTRLGALTRQARQQLPARGLAIFVPRHPLHAAAPAVEGVTSTAVYPLARHLRAFDAAVSMAGYNSFHELLMAGVPTVFVARETDTIDDQEGRARFAADAGAALHARDLGAPLAAQVRRLLDPTAAANLRAGAEALYTANGAPEAARLVAHLAQEG
jgi:hypothetical protein